MSNVPEKIYIHDIDAEDKDIDPAQYDVTGMTLYIRADIHEKLKEQYETLMNAARGINQYAGLVK